MDHSCSAVQLNGSFTREAEECGEKREFLRSHGWAMYVCPWDSDCDKWGSLPSLQNCLEQAAGLPGLMRPRASSAACCSFPWGLRPLSSSCLLILSPLSLLQQTTETGEDEEDQPLSLAWPSNARKQVTFLIVLPIVFPLWMTLPDVRKPVSKTFFN